jgi:hypothetical protein
MLTVSRRGYGIESVARWSAGLGAVVCRSVDRSEAAVAFAGGTTTVSAGGSGTGGAGRLCHDRVCGGCGAREGRGAYGVDRAGSGPGGGAVGRRSGDTTGDAALPPDTDASSSSRILRCSSCVSCPAASLSSNRRRSSCQLIVEPLAPCEVPVLHASSGFDLRFGRESGPLSPTGSTSARVRMVGKKPSREVGTSSGFSTTA